MVKGGYLKREVNDLIELLGVGASSSLYTAIEPFGYAQGKLRMALTGKGIRLSKVSKKSRWAGRRREYGPPIHPWQ